MKKYFTRKNIGWAMTGLLGIVLIFSAGAKLMGSEDVVNLLGSNNLDAKWVTIIGIGELASIILFIIPKTMRFGALMLSAYFGGAIMFHMTHPGPDLEAQQFGGAAAFLVFVWATAWVRGFNPFGE